MKQSRCGPDSGSGCRYRASNASQSALHSSRSSWCTFLPTGGYIPRRPATINANRASKSASSWSVQVSAESALSISSLRDTPKTSPGLDCKRSTLERWVVSLPPGRGAISRVAIALATVAKREAASGVDCDKASSHGRRGFRVLRNTLWMRSRC
jgi:hypothetical protein